MNDLVVACLDAGPDERRRECADVLYCAVPHAAVDAWLLAVRALARYPGCVLVLVPKVGGGCVVRVRPSGLTTGCAIALRGGAGRPR